MNSGKCPGNWVWTFPGVCLSHMKKATRRTSGKSHACNFHSTSTPASTQKHSDLVVFPSWHLPFVSFSSSDISICSCVFFPVCVRNLINAPTRLLWIFWTFFQLCSHVGSLWHFQDILWRTWLRRLRIYSPSRLKAPWVVFIISLSSHFPKHRFVDPIAQENFHGKVTESFKGCWFPVINRLWCGECWWRLFQKVSHVINVLDQVLVNEY